MRVTLQEIIIGVEWQELPRQERVEVFFFLPRIFLSRFCRGGLSLLPWKKLEIRFDMFFAGK